jgi:hypothetical protein
MLISFVTHQRRYVSMTPVPSAIVAHDDMEA